MSEGVIQRSFAGGELAPALHARADTARYSTALKECTNFIVRREGGVSNRCGFRFIAAAKDNVAGKKLVPFRGSTAGTGVLIEAGIGYFRFYNNGARVTVSGVPAWSAVTNYVPGDLVVQGGVNYYCHTANLNQVPPNASFWYPLTGNIYEIPHPFSTNPLFKWNQSGNVITFTEPGQQPRELIFESLTRWVLQLVSTAPSIGPPGGTSGVAGAAGTRTFKYVVTTAKIETYEESNPSAVITIINAADPTTAAPHALSWTAVPNAAEYYVYADPYVNGVFGFIGTAATNAFNDTGFIPDFNLTPPIPRTLFNSPNGFPSCSGVYQQRRWFANTNLEPDSVFGSRTGFRSNFGISSPLQDDDAVTFRMGGNNNHPVRHLVALKAGLLALTDGGEWTVTGAGGPKVPITPTSIDAEQETYLGISDRVRPVVIGNTVIYAQARGNIVHELRFNQEFEGLGGRDLTVYATHLFRRKTVINADYQHAPDSIAWFVRDDGVLLGLTYVPEQEVWGWHKHTTGAGGLFEDVAVVPESSQDALYALVARTIGGSTVRYIERLEIREARDGFFNADSFFVDSGLSYSGAPTTTVSGLGHLEGQLVAVLADGVVVFNGDPATATPAQITNFTVTGGTIAALATAASNIHVGIPIRFAQIELLDLDTQGSNIRDKKKSVKAVTLLVDRSSRTFWAGPDTTQLRQYIPDVYESAVASGEGLELQVVSDFNRAGRVVIRQTDPLPLTVLGVIPNVEMGG